MEAKHRVLAQGVQDSFWLVLKKDMEEELSRSLALGQREFRARKYAEAHYHDGFAAGLRLAIDLPSIKMKQIENKEMKNG